MMSAENFFTIESYDAILIENSTFRNASNRAIYFSLSNGKSSPRRVIIKDCIFEDNYSELNGAVIAFEGVQRITSEIYMNLFITNSQFRRNLVTSNASYLLYESY